MGPNIRSAARNGCAPKPVGADTTPPSMSMSGRTAPIRQRSRASGGGPRVQPADPLEGSATWEEWLVKMGVPQDEWADGVADPCKPRPAHLLPGGPRAQEREEPAPPRPQCERRTNGAARSSQATGRCPSQPTPRARRATTRRPRGTGPLSRGDAGPGSQRVLLTVTTLRTATPDHDHGRILPFSADLPALAGWPAGLGHLRRR